MIVFDTEANSSPRVRIAAARETIETMPRWDKAIRIAITVIAAMTLVFLAANKRQRIATNEGFAGQEAATSQEAQEVPTQQAAPEKEEDAQQQVAAGAAKSTPERKKCEGLIRTALRNGVIRSVQPLSEEMAVVVVGPAFLEATFDEKETVAHVISCSLATSGTRCVNLRLKEAWRNKFIGHYVACRLTMSEAR